MIIYPKLSRMQTTLDNYVPGRSLSFSDNNKRVAEEKIYHPKNRSTGSRQILIRRLIWINILFVALRVFKNPFVAIKNLNALRQLRNRYRSNKALPKYARSGKRYFVNYNTPGWPSPAFNRYAAHQLRRFSAAPVPTLHTLVFAITKKCGFQCEHCCEWLNLNKAETLSKEDLLLIIHRFHALGIAQVQLSGGEPLNRLHDIYFLLDNAPKGIDFWLYTTGHSLTQSKARSLKESGLTGITISLDHCEEEKHNAFRGIKDAFEKAIQAARFAREQDMLVCFSLCATREFISEENLLKYAALARQLDVSFIQVLEPKAVGHYAGKDVLLNNEQQLILETFTDTFNYDPAYAAYPTIVYHDYNKRRFGCSGSGADYVYVDTDGHVHTCPFCQQKLFSAFDDALPGLLLQMKTSGCGKLNFCYVK